MSLELSIVLATKNRANLLDEMLTSLKLSANKINYEVIVIDGNSTDNTLEILDKHNITDVYNESEILGEGRHSWPILYNWGFAKAKGEWLMYASDDIIFNKDGLNKTFELIKMIDRKIGGVAFFYKNISCENEWKEFGVDYTYGQNILINYGLINKDAFINVNGFNIDYKFYCADGDLCLKILEKQYAIIISPFEKIIHNNILDNNKNFNTKLSELDIDLYKSMWCDKIITEIPNPRRINLNSHESINNIQIGLSGLKNKKIKLHLGCGEQYFDGYINIDYPSANHNLMKVKADLFQDVTTLEYENNSIDEIRLHHVFEHFNRVMTTGLLIKWHKWLKVDGILHIETPDFEECSKKIIDINTPQKIKLALLRHIEGDQAANWAYHITHWTKERFMLVLSELGFSDIEFKFTTWEHEPYLSNIEVFAKKRYNFSDEKLLEKARIILWTATVNDSEMPTFNIWETQLLNFLNNKKSVYPEFKNDQLSINTIHNFNQINRDKWMIDKAANIKKKSKVIDIGAGTCPYKSLFVDCEYFSHDFKKYQGEKLGGTKEYAKIDIESDIVSIPVEDGYFDVVICTEVLEHVPEPIKAINEMSRILKKGGTLFLTAPLGSGLHQLPYHYYGGFTPEWYKKFLNDAGLIINEITPNGGFFKHLNQECARAANILNESSIELEKKNELINLLNETLPTVFYELDDKLFIENFTVGYFVEAIKK